MSKAKKLEDLKKIAVICGGRSSERSVSLRSGKACYEAIVKLGYEAILVDIQGRNEVVEILDWKPDLAFLTTHGEGGEDGTIQGLLEWLDIPYTGSGVKASALCMDKYASKLLLKEYAIPLTEIKVWDSGINFKKICEQWNCDALFVKPRWGGSSLGNKILRSQNDIDHFDDSEFKYVVEPFFKGREMTVGFIADENGWKALPILELVPEGEYYDYESKYTAGKTQFILPANLSKSEEDEMISIGEKCLDVCGVSCYARVDFLISKEKMVVLEINTLPGMTATSDVPAQAKSNGISFEKLVEILLNSVFNSSDL